MHTQIEKKKRKEKTHTYTHMHTDGQRKRKRRKNLLRIEEQKWYKKRSINTTTIHPFGT